MQTSKLKCPHCGNNRLLIRADFKNKAKTDAVGICIRTAYKTVKFFGNPVIKGCGQTFDIKLKRDK